MKKRIISFLTAVVMVFTMLPQIPITAFAEEQGAVLSSGNCGPGGSDTATYKVYDTDGDKKGDKLVISGTGATVNLHYTDYPLIKDDNKYTITTIVIEEGITEIGDYLFNDMTGVTTIYIPNSLTSIGWASIENCTALTDIVFSDSPTLNFLDDAAFANCTSLKDNDLFTLAPLETLGKCLYNTAYSTVILPPSVTSVDGGIINSENKVIYMPQSAIPAYTDKLDFYAGVVIGYSLDSETKTATLTLHNTGYTSYVNSVIIPSALFDYEVVAVTNQLEGLTINCLGHKIVNRTCQICRYTTMCGDNCWWEFEDGVLYIKGSGDMFDYDCREGSKGYPGWMKLHKNEIREVHFAEEITSIGKDILYDAPNLTTVVFEGDKITHIRQRAFSLCDALTEVPLEKLTSLENIQDAVFYGCTSLKDITLSAKTLNLSPFYGCTNIKAAFNEDLLIGVGFDYPMMLYKWENDQKFITVPFADMLEISDIEYFEGEGIRQQQPQDLLKIKDEYAEGYSFDGYTYGANVDFSKFTYSINKEIAGIGDYALNLSYQYKTNDASQPTLTKTIQIPFKVVEHIHSTGKDGDRAATCMALGYCSACESEYGTFAPHSYTHKVINNVITETCSYGCSHSATVSIAAPTNLVYGGTAKEAVVTSNLATDKELAVTYTPADKLINSKPVNAGEYTATLSVGSTKVSVDFEILPKTITEDMVSVSNERFVYDGKEQKPTVTVKDGSVTLAEGTDYTVSYSNNINATTETSKAKVTVAGIGNYKGKITKEFEIGKSEPTAANFKFTPPADLTYDGKAKAATVTADGVTGMGEISVLYQKDGAQENLLEAIDAGTYKVIIGVKAGGNFTVSQEHLTADSWTFTISPADIACATVTLSSEEYVYNGGRNEPDVTVILGGTTLVENTDYSLTYSNNVNAGTAKVTVKGIGNYTGEIEKEFTIKPKPVDITWRGKTFYYTGKPHTVVTYMIGDLGLEQAVTGAENATNTEIGTYTATMQCIKIYYLEEDGIVNTNLIPSEATKTHTYEIKWYDGAPNATISGTLGENGWYVSDVILTAPEGYTISKTVDGNYGNQITISGEGEFVYYLKQNDTGYIAKFEIKIDKSTPTAEIAMTDVSTPWTEFVNNITFGLFFNETIEIAVTAEDSLSGVKSIEYIESLTALSLDNAKTVDSWKSVGTDNKISVTAEDAKTFVYYFRITDNAGNIAFFSTAGATFDTTAPVISGITEGETYCTTQKFTVTDANLDKVTVNGVESTEYTLAGDKEETYTVVATDAAGNIATVTVTMKTITSVEESINNLTTDNVTADDLDIIKAVEATLDTINKTNATDDEKYAIDVIKTKIESLKKVIEETAEEITTLTDAVANYDNETVKSTDKEAVDTLIADLTEKLSDANISAQHRSDIFKAIDEAKELAEKIDSDKQAREDAMENADTAIAETSATDATVENIEALAAVKTKLKNLKSDDNYTETEKAEIQILLDKINKLAEKITDGYEITAGAENSWTKGSSKTIGFTSNGLSEYFEKVKVDGKTIALDTDYTTRGNTIVTLKSEYLGKLSTGTHKLEIVFNVLDKEAVASCDFTIKSEPASTSAPTAETTIAAPAATASPTSKPTAKPTATPDSATEQTDESEITTEPATTPQPTQSPADSETNADSQPTSQTANSLPIIPIIVVVIAAIFFIFILAKKKRDEEE